MRVCDKCGTQVKDGLSFCQKCGNILGEAATSANQTATYPPVPAKPKKKIGCLTVLLWIFFLPIMIIVTIAKSEKMSKKQKAIWIMALVVVFLLIGIFAPRDDTSTPNGTANSSPSPSSQVENSAPAEADMAETKTDEVNKPAITSIEASDTTTSWETEVGGVKKFTYYILPYEAEGNDIKIVSTNPDVAETKLLDLVGVTGKKVLTMSIITKAIGTTSVFVKSSDEAISSNEFKVTVTEKKEPPKDTSRTVYVTPTGSKYHYDPQCGGKNSTATTLNRAKSMGLSSCSKCVN